MKNKQYAALLEQPLLKSLLLTSGKISGIFNITSVFKNVTYLLVIY